MAKQTKIAILGMGYVGLTLAVVMAKKKLKVYGIETNSNIVQMLKQNNPHFQEIGLKSLLKHQQLTKNLEIYTTLPQETMDAYIISVGTPLLKNSKKPNVDYIQNVVIDVAKHMKKGALVILRSTVPVGLSRNMIIPLLEKESGLKVGVDFSFSFAPERTIEGKAILELEKNSQIIGGYDEKSVKLTLEIFRKLTSTIVTVSSIESSEMIKLIDNSYRDVKFAYCNEIAMIAENLKLDAKELIEAANTHYNRNNIPLPSPGVGGACLSKDPYILYDLSKKKGYSPELIREGRNINEKIPKKIVIRIKSKLKKYNKDLKTAKIFIVGFAFKGNPETSDLRDSTSLWFLDELKKETDSNNIFGYDPVVDEKDLKNLDINVCKTLEEGYTNADVVLFLNNHTSYQKIDAFEVCQKMNKPAIFYDAWRMFEKEIISSIKNIEYMGVGL